MKFADLHLHSYFSDGTFSPEELVGHGARLGFAALALFCGGLAAAEPVAAAAPITPSWVPSDGANHPLGVGKGIFPGRVVWIRDLAATPWDGKTGHWWEDGTGIDQAVVSAMMSKSLRTLSGAAADPAAWAALSAAAAKLSQSPSESPGQAKPALATA